MKTITSAIFGAFSAVIAILLHQTIPPLGVVLGLALSMVSIWTVGRMYSLRRYKFLATLSWLAVIVRAGTFGTGQELLLQGDGVGTSLMMLGIVLLLFIAMRKDSLARP